MPRREEAAGIALAFGAAAFLAAYFAFHEAILGPPVYSDLEVAFIVAGGGLALVFASLAALVTWTSPAIPNVERPLAREVEE